MSTEMSPIYLSLLATHPDHNTWEAPQPLKFFCSCWQGHPASLLWGVASQPIVRCGFLETASCLSACKHHPYNCSEGSFTKLPNLKKEPSEWSHEWCPHAEWHEMALVRLHLATDRSAAAENMQKGYNLCLLGRPCSCSRPPGPQQISTCWWAL